MREVADLATDGISCGPGTLAVGDDYSALASAPASPEGPYGV